MPIQKVLSDSNIFKWIKQHLRITSFYGTSANAVMIQIYTALTAFCTLALAADALRHEGTLYEFANMMSSTATGTPSPVS